MAGTQWGAQSTRYESVGVRRKGARQEVVREFRVGDKIVEREAVDTTSDPVTKIGARCGGVGVDTVG